MGRARYTDAQRDEALAVYAEHGAAEASRRTGISQGTLKSWASRTGVASVATETTRAAVEAHALAMTARKSRLALGLMDDIERLRSELWAPAVERKVVTVGCGVGHSEAEIIDVELTQPTFSDQRAIMTSLAIAVDKVQLLTGQPTSRTETVVVDQLDQEMARLAERVMANDPVTA